VRSNSRESLNKWLPPHRIGDNGATVAAWGAAMKAMKQLSLAETGFLPKAAKQTRKAVFLSEMERVVPWARLEALIEPVYPKKGNGRPPMPLATMLRIHFLQQWFGYSDPAMEEALHDVPLLRRFAGLDAFEDVMPDESTVLRFRHLLESHDLAGALFAEVNALLAEKGLSMKRGSVVDATLIAAPSSTKNQAKQRDPEMSQTKKGQQWYFGMKAHIGVDAKSGLVHTVECTTAKVADNTMLKACLHGEETLALGDRGYHQKNRTLDALEAEDGVCIVTPTKKPQGGELTEEQKRLNRMLSAVRAVVEHPFRVVKQQFRFIKVRYRGLKKNTGQIVTLFALANLWLARRRLLPSTGEVRP
jgi:IS5 family transposase